MEYICNNCNARYPKWMGKCTSCNQWETIVEDKELLNIDTRGRWLNSTTSAVELDKIKIDETNQRWKTGVDEFDQVIGGGFIPDSVGLLGGEPGIGKSTLILQLIGRLQTVGKKCLYISGEESINQIKSRSDRLTTHNINLLVAIESELENIINLIQDNKPDFVVIDSIQTVFSNKNHQPAGSILQIRDCSAIITQYAKNQHCSFLLVAHVTKDGNIAGPKTIEHMVDYVLYLEGTPNEDFRYLRAIKNRYGNINEIGFFKMTNQGLSEVLNPNKIFIDQWKTGKYGSVIFPTSEGSRIMFVEVQALVSMHVSNYPSRTTLGIERNRLLIIIAILEKQLKLNLTNHDVYLNIASGIKISDPSVDMAIIGAIYSSLKNIKFNNPVAMLGEAVLSGTFNNARHCKDKIYAIQQSNIDHCFYSYNKDLSSNKNYHNIKDIPQLTNILSKF